MVLAQNQICRSMKQNRKPRKQPTLLWELISMTKEARIYNGDKITSSINGVGKTVWPHAKESNWTLTSCTQKNSKWIKDLNVRPDTIKLLEENIDRTLHDINHSKILFDPPPREMEIKTKINKWDLMKLKTFAQQRKP